MRQMRCTLNDGATIQVTGDAYVRVIAGGAIVDLDEVIAAARAGDAPRPAVTLGDALGHHVDEAFAPVQTSAPARHQPARQAARGDQE